jgi:hypothetical protein
MAEMLNTVPNKVSCTRPADRGAEEPDAGSFADRMRCQFHDRRNGCRRGGVELLLGADNEGALVAREGRVVLSASKKYWRNSGLICSDEADMSRDRIVAQMA